MEKQYTTFEDLEVYQAARKFRNGVYRLAKTLPNDERYGLSFQIRRAAVSLTSNIAEGHGRYHYQDNIHFLRQSRGSLQEIIDQLNTCLDENYAERIVVESLKQEAYAVLRRLNGYIKYLVGRKEGSRKVNESPVTNYQLPVTSYLSRRRGFTLIEIMLVVIIIGVLAAMVVPRLSGRTEQAKVARSRSDLAAVGLALDLYELDMGKYPASLQELVASEAPSSLSQEQKEAWNGPYLKKGLPKDPWGRDYQYQAQSQHNQDYDLFSLGADGQPGNDDVTNWK